jgi:membrane protease YdiL (CAAX protease family)
MILIFVFGMILGFFALWRKSLPARIIAHAWQDAFSGVLLFIVARKGFVAMP